MTNLGHFINNYEVKNVERNGSTAYKNISTYVKHKLKKLCAACILGSEENTYCI